MAVRTTKYVDKFKLPKVLEYNVVSLRGVARNWEKPREAYLQSPKSLVNLCADLLDRQPLPPCMYWKVPDVQYWLEHTIHLPQYKGCFEKNFIDGRHLILLGPNHLVKMNITNHHHIVQIMESIRAEFGVPRPKFARDLTLPSIMGTEYDWNTLYYRYIARQSLQHVTPRSIYWRKAKMMTATPESACHWYNIHTGLDVQGKVIVARVKVNLSKRRWFVPMFRENNYLPTTIKVDYLDNDPLTW